MDWKEFFRPNKARLLVLVSIVAISILTIIWTFSVIGGSLTGSYHGSRGKISFGTALFFIIFPTEALKNFGIYIDYPTIIHLVYWYLLSCTIVAVYNKVKEKKQ